MIRSLYASKKKERKWHCTFVSMRAKTYRGHEPFSRKHNVLGTRGIASIFWSFVSFHGLFAFVVSLEFFVLHARVLANRSTQGNAILLFLKCMAFGKK